MVRCVGQILAVVAMMASAMNAQCALSCWFQNAKPASVKETQGIHAPVMGHACCPKKTRPGQHRPHRDPQEQSCDMRVLTTSEFGLANPLPQPDAHQFFDGPSVDPSAGVVPVRAIPPLRRRLLRGNSQDSCFLYSPTLEPRLESLSSFGWCSASPRTPCAFLDWTKGIP